MAVARPPIVADLPALTEIAPDGVRSLAYPTGEPAGLAAAVARLMDDPGLAAHRLGRPRMGRCGSGPRREPAALDAVYRSVLTPGGGRDTILHLRRASNDARTAALDVFAALRAQPLGIQRPRLMADGTDDADHPLRPRAIRAWSAGVAVVDVADDEARDAARATAASVGAEAIDPMTFAEPMAAAAEPSPHFDGRQLAARHALGIGPDETVDPAIGATAGSALGRLVAAFDERSAAASDATSSIDHRGTLAHRTDASRPS